MLKSYAKGTNGYHEVSKSRGSDVSRSKSPPLAFYSTIDDNHPAGEVRYKETDIVEMTQRQSQKSGKSNESPTITSTPSYQTESWGAGRERHRPTMNVSRGFKQTNTATAFDPRTDFRHLRMSGRKDMIIWYVDGAGSGTEAQ